MIGLIDESLTNFYKALDYANQESVILKLN